MAKPLTATQVVAALKKWGVLYRLAPGYATRQNKGSFVDITGCMFHHTGNDASDKQNLDLLIRGRAGLPGPLCNFGVADDGTVDVIALGSANHAGGGDPKVLAAVQKESYTSYPPKTTKTHGETGSTSGNSRFYGWEVYYGLGRDLNINDLQYRATILSMVAIIDALDALDGPTKWTSKSIIGHKEWQEGKPDPAGVDMKVARADAQWCLDKGPTYAKHWYLTGSKTLPAPKPVVTKPVPTSEEDALFMVQVTGLDPVYKTDGFKRVHITAVQRDALKKAGVKHVMLANADELAAFGDEEVAEAPPTGKVGQ